VRHTGHGLAGDWLSGTESDALQTDLDDNDDAKCVNTLPMRQHVEKSFALQLHVNISEMFNTTTDDLEALSLVDAVKPWKPVEQLCTEPS